MTQWSSQRTMRRNIQKTDMPVLNAHVKLRTARSRTLIIIETRATAPCSTGSDKQFCVPKAYIRYLAACSPAISTYWNGIILLYRKSFVNRWPRRANRHLSRELHPLSDVGPESCFSEICPLQLFWTPLLFFWRSSAFNKRPSLTFYR